MTETTRPEWADELHALWMDSGKTLAEIGHALDITRNTVAGRIRKMRQDEGVKLWPNRPRDPGAPRKKQARPAPAPKPVAEPPSLEQRLKAFIPSGPTTAFSNLTHDCCRWPLHCEGVRGFCGRPRAGKGRLTAQYCAEHSHLAVRPSPMVASLHTGPRGRPF